MNMWHMYIMGYYSTVRKNHVELEMIVLSVVTQTKKDEHHIFSGLQYQTPSPQLWVNTMEPQKPGECKGAVGKGDLRGD